MSDQPAVRSGLHFPAREKLVEIINATPQECLGLLTIRVDDASVKHILVEMTGTTATLTAVRE